MTIRLACVRRYRVALTAAVMVCGDLRRQKYDKSKFEQLAECERRTHTTDYSRQPKVVFCRFIVTDCGL